MTVCSAGMGEGQTRCWLSTDLVPRTWYPGLCRALDSQPLELNSIFPSTHFTDEAAEAHAGSSWRGDERADLYPGSMCASIAGREGSWTMDPGAARRVLAPLQITAPGGVPCA